MFEFGAILEGVRPGVTLRWAGSRSGLANNSLSRTDRAADEWPAQCLPTISLPINSPALKLCHERASDHWPYLVRPLGDGLSFSAHRRCDRAATKRSSASTFKHGRRCLIIGCPTLVFMISSVMPFRACRRYCGIIGAAGIVAALDATPTPKTIFPDRAAKHGASG